MMAAETPTGLRGVLRENEPLARHTSWRTGGPADRFFQPADIDDLALFLGRLPPDEPVYWIGLGSNLLVRDGGIRGTVIATSGALNGLAALDDGIVRAEAGVTCAKVARFCARLGYTGTEFLAGIPGTIGGALTMNAGAFGGETWSLIAAVETVDRGGRLHTRLPDEYRIGYRQVIPPATEWFVAAHLRATPGDSAQATARIRELLNQRNASQPIGVPSCGSVFRNPPGDHAARLIEASGLKGFRVGGAKVSTKHANFIINTGAAIAADIEKLIEHVAAVVQRQHGVALLREVHIVGEASAAAASRQTAPGIGGSAGAGIDPLPARIGDDPRVFGGVAVLMGGLSAEREISLNSGRAVLAALQRRGVDATAIDVDTDIAARLAGGGFDRAFIVLHGRGGEDGTIQGLLDTLGMPYTGSGVLGSALGMDKLRSKWIWHGLGLPTPGFIRLDDRSSPERVVTELGLPLVVKPASEGSSLGMTRITSTAQLADAWRVAREYDTSVLAEQWITGAEYTAAILGRTPLPLIRIETPREFYDYEAKYRATDTRYHCPTGLDADSESELQQLALAAFDAIGASGWGRVDILCDTDGRPWLIEANTVPGMTDHSLVPKAARAAGLEFDELVWRILETSLRPAPGRQVQRGGV